MGTDKILKFKKYLFLISIIFLVSSLSHLIYTYLSYDSKIIPIKGGSISEGIIGDFPSLNPLTPLAGNNKYMVHLLYRSLLKYDIEEQKIVSDIASCDISDLSQIECYLESNIKWSNDQAITLSDIEATYKVFQTTNINKITSSLLANTEIIRKEDSIVFKNPKKDVNFLNIFFQPIVSEEIIDTLGEANIGGNFSASNGIYSGKFKLTNISNDASLGITKFFLQKNEYYEDNDIFIEQMIIKLFSSANDFLKHKEGVNIINDKENLLGESVPRLESHKYTLNQYIGLFLNKEKIQNKDLRNFILNTIKRENLVTILGDRNYAAVTNPYLTEVSVQRDLNNKNVGKLIKSLGYKRKSEILKNFVEEEKRKQKYSDEVEIKSPIVSSSGSETPEITTPIQELNSSGSIISIDDFQEKSKTIIEPNFIDKYNYITQANLLLKGNVEDGIESVYVNDYQLQGFDAGDTSYYYRLNSSTLQLGRNDYVISFEKGGIKEKIETITFLYNPNITELELLKEKLIAEFIKQNKEETEEAKKQVKVEEKQDVYIPSFKPDAAGLAKIEALDDEAFYNEKFEKFELSLYFINTEKHLEASANYIQKSLDEAGIDIRLNPITLAELPGILSEEDKPYDIILTGINTGYFKFNIFPYFHSSQVKSGYNFSNIKKLSLDILLEELRGNTLSKNKIIELEKKVLGIIQDEQIVKILYTPKLNNLVDKSIKNYSMPNHFPDEFLRAHSLSESYINEKKIINFDSKSTWGFFGFLKDL